MFTQGKKGLNIMSNMEFFKSISIDEAIDIASNFGKTYTLDYEVVNFEDALGRFAFENIVSSENIPNFNRSRMDGFALKSKETIGSSETMPSLFNIIGTVSIGEKPNFKINSEECTYVPTGGEIPEGADAVVMIENTDTIGENELLCNKSTAANENITMVGEDIKTGEVVIEKGTKLTAFHIGVLASLGIETIKVFKKPKVSIISTGDEIVPVSKKNLVGTEIRDINTHCLKAQLKEFGCEVISTNLVKDNYDLLKESILSVIELSDFIIMSGGSSVGERDYMNKLLKELGEVFFHGIRIKPGKPVLFGSINNKAFFGLPGNPVSCSLTCDLIISEFVKALNNSSHLPIKGNLPINTNIHSAPGKDTFQMIDIIDGKAAPILGRSSMISMMAKAKGYIRISEHKEGLYKDENIEVHFLNR